MPQLWVRSRPFCQTSLRLRLGTSKAARLVALPLLLACAATVQGSASAAPASKAHVDIVFAIDCSGSMGPVIEAAKQKVWTIVNHVATAKPSPVLRIGLIGYGNGEKDHRIFPLSDDLDAVYRDLMTFRDEGWGSEFVGLAVHKATSGMQWSSSGTNLKVIYVLGNETARQGPPPMDYALTTPVAARRGIIVNAIYCDGSRSQTRSSLPNVTPQKAPNRASAGAPASQVRSAPPKPQGFEPDSEKFSWRDMARLGRGEYLEIAGDGGVINIPTPYDAQLGQLGTQINTTYIPYGSRGSAGAANQMAQDSNALSAGGVSNYSARSNAKAQLQYNNRNWDLVDASREKGFDYKTLKSEELPAAMRPMTATQRAAYVQKNAAQRASLQRQIRDLGLKRDQYIQQQIKKQKLDTTNSFDDAVRRSITSQGKTKGFKF